MIKIKQKRLKSLKKYAPLIQGKRLIVCLDLAGHETEAKKIGFSSDFESGETILPAEVGTVTAYNSEGREVVRKDLPLETHYRQAEWTWEQWCGRGMTETHSKIVDIPYEKYHRDFIEPPGFQLKTSHGKIISSVFAFPEDEESIKHVINMFLEIFGECRLLNEKFEEFINVPTKSLNWLILPEGPLPWDRLQRSLKTSLRNASGQEKVVYRDRLSTIEFYKPDFRRIGMAGFAGYVIFGFEKKNLYIFESIWHGNAIYVFEGTWEEVSKMTKAQIIRGGLQKDRIIHYEDWKERIDELLS